MNNRPIKRLSILLAFALALTAVFPLASALAAAYQPQPGATLEDFVSAKSDQFTIGVDSNSFMHYFDSFGHKYTISQELVDQLLSIDPSGTSQMQLLSLLHGDWGGSCYGVSTTMILNRLTQDGKTQNPLPLEYMQPGAKVYYDLGIPLENPGVLNTVNYYMLSQVLSPATDARITVMLTYANPAGMPESTDAEKAQKAAVVAANAENKEALDRLVEFVKARVDADQTFEFSFGYSAGGHAIVGCDYWIDGKGTPDESDDDLYLKLYDLNDFLKQPPEQQHFNYLKIKEYHKESAASPESTVLYEYSYADGRYKPIELSNILVTDVDAANEYLNIADPRPYGKAPSGLPELSIYDLNNNYDSYTIRPLQNDDYIYINGDQPGEKLYWADILFLKVNPTMGDVIAPCSPLSAGLSNPQYIPPSSAENYDYWTFADAELNMDVQMKTGASVDYGPSLQASAVFSGYEVAVNAGKSCEFSMARDNRDGTANYALVSGANVGGARFGLDGRLRKIYGAGGAATGLELFFGTMGGDTAFDMFLLEMPSCESLEVYGGNDYAPYNGSVVLRSNSFYDGGADRALGFAFFKGAQVSDFIRGSTDSPGDKWLKISGQPDSSGNIQISIWSASDPATGIYPDFTGEPDWTTVIDRSSGGSSGDGREPGKPVEIAPAKPSASIAGNALKKALSIADATVYQSGGALVVRAAQGAEAVSIGDAFDWDYAFRAGITEIVIDFGYARVSIPTENRKGGVSVGLRREGEGFALELTPPSLRAGLTFTSASPVSPSTVRLSSLVGGQWTEIEVELKVQKSGGKYFVITEPLPSGVYKLG